jgi:hypothetical protein
VSTERIAPISSVFSSTIAVVKPLCLQTPMLTRGEWLGSAALNALLLDIAESFLAPVRGAAFYHRPIA